MIWIGAACVFPRVEQAETIVEAFLGYLTADKAHPFIQDT